MTDQAKHHPQGVRWSIRSAAALLVLLLCLPALAQRATKDANDPEPKPFQKRQKVTREDPIVLTADNVTYDAKTETVVATGRVEVTQRDRTLRTDRLIFDRRQDVVRAEGHVVLIEPTGEVLFADTMDMTGDFKNAVAENMRMLLSNDAKVAANGGRRENGNITELSRTTYSACDLCKDDPMKPPLWQVKSRKVVHDKTEKELYFYDSTFELFGIPIAYIPYFSHYDPSVKRATGFLAPVYGHGRDIGFEITVPYYIVIDDQRDITMYPRYTTKRGPVLATEYRQRWDHATLRLEGSITKDIYQNDQYSNNVRGHIFGRFLQDLDDVWRVGVDLQRTTDKYYLRSYDFGKSNYLTSRAYAEGFWQRSYFGFDAYSFQELRPEFDSRNTPYFAPRFQFNYIGDPLPWGGHWIFNTNSRGVLRDVGTDSVRYTALAGYEMPTLITSGGHVFDLLATVRTDFFYGSDVVDPNDSTNTFTGAKVRPFPQIAATWRYPLARYSEGSTYQFIEPIVGFVAGPKLGRQWHYPNEDSLEQVFDDTNLFFPNRTAGGDIVDSGQRLNYGLRFGFYDVTSNGVVGFVGQSLRAQSNHYFSEASGLRDKLSDIVASVMVNPGGWWDATVRTRLDKSKPSDVRQLDAFVSAGPKEIRPWVQYIRINDDLLLKPDDSIGERRELRIGFSSMLGSYWRFLGWGARDMVLDKISGAALDVQYEDECFLAGVRLSHRFPIQVGDKPDNRIIVRLVVKQFTDTKF